MAEDVHGKSGDWQVLQITARKEGPARIAGAELIAGVSDIRIWGGEKGAK